MMSSPIAFLLPQYVWGALGCGGAFCALLGMWYAWQRQWHRSDVEEKLKERKVTEDQAQRQIRFIEIRAALLICAGVALVIISLFNLGD
jgi:hypothetical protein